jgi:hypothetical protein
MNTFFMLISPVVDSGLNSAATQRTGKNVLLSARKYGRRCCCQAATTGLADHLQSTVSSDRGAATLPGNTSHTKLAGIGRADMNLFR